MLIFLDKTSENDRIQKQNLLFYDVSADSECICPDTSGSIPDLDTEKAAADSCHLNLPVESLFSLINFSELLAMIDASSTSESAGDLDTNMCTCSGLA